LDKYSENNGFPILLWTNNLGYFLFAWVVCPKNLQKVMNTAANTTPFPSGLPTANPDRSRPGSGSTRSVMIYQK
jgi:hypothetical protein